jgi:hypothetical protein
MMKRLLLVTLYVLTVYPFVLEVQDTLEIRTWEVVNRSKSLLVHHIDLMSFSQSKQVRFRSYKFSIWAIKQSQGGCAMQTASRNSKSHALNLTIKMING